MKLPKFKVFFLISSLMLTVHASAATFTDDMVFAQNTAETQYFSLKPYAGNVNGISDPTILTFLNPASPLGSAIYRVNGAEKVTVGIYSAYGTRVIQADTGPVLGPGDKQASWSRSANFAYSDFGGSLRRLELLQLSRGLELVFTTVVPSLPPDAKGYALNIYASPDFDRPLTAFVTKSVKEEDFFFYEEYTAFVSPASQYIKVEVNDVTSYLLGGAPYPNNNAVRMTRLALVQISGTALIMGEPEIVVQQPSAAVQGRASGDDDKQDKQSEEKYSNAHDSAELPKETENEAETASEASKEKSSSSKFEGTITASSKSEKKTAPKVAAKIEASSKTSKPDENSSEAEESRHDTVYEVRREKDGGLMGSAVTAYIIIVTGALSLLLIFGRKR